MRHGKWLRQVVFGDVDAMFASAAIVAGPSLAGKPVAVGGPPPRGIIAAASYAVRAFGVHSAMEAETLLKAGIDTPILIMGPVFPHQFHSRSVQLWGLP